MSRTDDLRTIQTKARKSAASLHEYLKFVIRIEPKAHQAGWLEACQDIGNAAAGQRYCIIAPPGAGKSVFIGVGFLSWIIGKNPGRHYGMLSYADQVAWDRALPIRNVIGQSKAFKRVFPEVEPDLTAWDKKGFRLKRENIADPHPTLRAGGVGSAVVSYRLNGLVLDDVLDIKTAKTSRSRGKVYDDYVDAVSTRMVKRAWQLCIGCLTADSPVLMADGSWKPIVDVRPGDKVWSADADGRRAIGTVAAMVPQGEDDVFLVETDRNSVKGNARHPFLVFANGGLEWKHLGDLVVGDIVVTAKDFRGGAEMDKDLAWLAGMLLADGWGGNNGRHGQYLCHALGVDEGLNEKTTTLVSRFFGAEMKKTRSGYQRADKKGLYAAAQRMGLTAGARNKRVPDWAHYMNSAAKAAFLRGLCDGDGSEQRGTWRLASASEALIRGARALALTCGVRPGRVLHRERMIQAPHSRAPALSHEWSVSLNFCAREAVETVHGKAFRPRPLGRLLGGEWRLQRVRSVRPAGRARVYDLSVDGSESFIADGFVVHNTRWSDDDFIGRLLALRYHGAPIWTAIHVPAILPNGRSYWPEEYPMEDLLQKKDTMPSNFAIQYQGDTTGGETQVIKRLATYDEYERGEDGKVSEEFVKRKDLLMGAGWDTGLKDKQENDYSVMYVGGLDRYGNIWVIDREKGRFTISEIVALSEAAYFKWRTMGIWFEDSAVGTPAVTTIREEMPSVPCGTVYYGGGKRSRANVLAQYLHNGQVRFPKLAGWFPDCEYYLKHFGHADHDDDVDALFILVDNLLQIRHPADYENRPRVGVVMR